MGNTQAPIEQPTGQLASRFDMEILVGYVLLVGVMLSVALIAAGIIWRWANTGRLGLDYTIAGSDVFDFAAHQVRGLARDDVRPRRLVNLGFVCLMLTPYVRVLVSMIYFAVVQRNWKYTLFTGVVFGILSYSLFLR